MATFEELKAKFAAIAAARGFILESDYNGICHGITDQALLNHVAHWILSQGIPLKKCVGPQYKQELMRRVKNPHVRDVVDTKDRTHNNPDKLQESKKTSIEAPTDTKQATLNLNDKIEDNKDKDFKEPFLPPWKKRTIMLKKGMRVEASTSPVAASLKLYAFMQENPEVFDLLVATFGLDAATWDIMYNADGVRQYINTSVVPYLPDRAYLDPNTFPQLSGINLGNQQAAEQALSTIDDVDTLNNIVMSLERREYFEDPAGATEETWDKMPSGTREIEFDAAKKAVRQAKLARDLPHVDFSNPTASFVVDIADTPAKKAAGLETFEALAADHGLYFPFGDPNLVTFHMGSVKFPIDIVFLMPTPHGMEINKIVEDVKPGALDVWTANNVVAVLEVIGGACKKHGLRVGSNCTYAAEKE